MESPCSLSMMMALFMETYGSQISFQLEIRRCYYKNSWMAIGSDCIIAIAESLGIESKATLT